MPDAERPYHPDNYLLRDYLASDWPQVEKLWSLTGVGAPERGDDHHTITRTLQLGGKMFILEEREKNKIVGCAWVTNDGRRLHLHHMAIDPASQGQGLSHLLVRSSLELAREMKMQIKLEVHRLNRIAINLYTKWNFAYLGDYDVYIDRDPARIDTPEK